ncbi:MAG TPA: hypothetical protein VIK00_00370 [Candidatus Limnocylindrales bacterium]
MVHHLWYGSFADEADDIRGRAWRKPMTRQPIARRGGARQAVGRALIGLGALIAAEPENKKTAGK